MSEESAEKGQFRIQLEMREFYLKVRTCEKSVLFIYLQPQVTRNLFINCKEVQELIKKKFPPKNKYRYILVDIFI